MRPSRRRFLTGTAAASLLLPFASAGNDLLAAGGLLRRSRDPSTCSSIVDDQQYRTLVAFINAQLTCLWGGSPGDCAHAVAHDVLEYMQYVPTRMSDAFGYLLTWMNVYSIRIMRKPLEHLTACEVWTLFNQGEYQTVAAKRMGKLHRLSFDATYVEHVAVQTMAMLTRLVTNSRTPNRLLVGMTWSKPCRNAENLVKVPPPARPCLDQHWDVCIVGSGAGGSIMAARLAAAGKHVLIVESGRWFSPDALIERRQTPDGQTQLLPARGDRVLMHLYKDAGVQVAGGIADKNLKIRDVVLPWRRQNVRPKQTVNVLQAHVAGGGPYVNNAIHLPMKEHVWNRWGERAPSCISYEQFIRRSEEITADLGVSHEVSTQNASDRSLMFAHGCQLAGETVIPLPIAVRKDDMGCGSDNSMDPFGSHVGGVHPHQPDKPNSYLMRALQAQTPAQIVPETRAVRFEFDQTCGSPRAARLVVEDRRGRSVGQTGCQSVINADQFVLSAGPIASTKILQQSLACSTLNNRCLGSRFNGNVGTPVYAIYDKPIIDGEPDRPEPGVAQCFLVDEELDWSSGQPTTKLPALENWFHYPGTIALALTGWFHEYARVLRKFNHLSIAGMFVPTQPRRKNHIDADGKPRLELSDSEFNLLMAGMERIANIYLATATPENGVEIVLPTKGQLLDDCGRPFRIRNHADLAWALQQIRCRGPQFVNLLSSHPQGGNALGSVVDRESFRLMTQHGEIVDNLYVADASIFPAGCEINPQLTVKTLASFAADHLLAAA